MRAVHPSPISPVRYAACTPVAGDATVGSVGRRATRPGETRRLRLLGGARFRVRSLAVAATAAAFAFALCAPAVSPASVTIGSDLSGSVDFGGDCLGMPGPCT